MIIVTLLVPIAKQLVWVCNGYSEEATDKDKGYAGSRER